MSHAFCDQSLFSEKILALHLKYIFEELYAAFGKEGNLNQFEFRVIKADCSFIYNTATRKTMSK
jgi:hypothetical protein